MFRTEWITDILNLWEEEYTSIIEYDDTYTYTCILTMNFREWSHAADSSAHDIDFDRHDSRVVFLPNLSYFHYFHCYSHVNKHNSWIEFCLEKPQKSLF